ncbi:S8 family serine peptidase [Kribbella sp. NBC_01510]|uniref:S8 family serine peptidase n=1 Tax=Kribbella sp. NBC_01510 TaxID=2903581 RepID=UPI003869853C
MPPRRLTALVLAGTLTAALLATAGTATALPPTTAAPEQSGTGSATDLVTLVTGDVVRLDTQADGTQQATVVAGAPGGTYSYVRDGDVYVEPASAQELLAAGKLDPRLFDVSALVRQGYGDADRTTLPLIVTYRSGAAVSPKAAPAGVQVRAALAGVRALAVTRPKQAGTTFLAEIERRTDVAKVWLDARTRAVPTDRTTDTAAATPKTQGSYDGTGSTIAILDTGIDASHPDFADRIDEARDFTGANDPTDRLGSGTHTASVAAGSGAASNGRYVGAAPGAHLAAGKVFDDTGIGYESWAIAGLQWAAASGADVVDVNVEGAITRGDDPLTEAVDSLSRTSDALFVVSTGSKGPGQPGTSEVAAPAAAAAALTVGGTRQTRWWDQSRHGVMADRGAIKPELVAPAFGVVGAVPGGGYASVVGTAPAAAYSAGAAAVLHQVHPDWSPSLLKATLTSTAAPVSSGTAFTAGGGAVDLARATAQQVTVDQGVASFGDITRPYRADQLRQQRTLTYHNYSQAAVSLDLVTDLAGTSVHPSTVTIAPGGAADVTLELDATALAADDYTGRVTATGPDGGIATAVGFVKQDDTVEVTFRALDRHGSPATARIRVAPYRQVDGRYYPEDFFFTPDQKEWTLRLPEGDYNVFGLLRTPDASGAGLAEVSIVGLPKLAAQAPNSTVTLDARTARPMTLTTPKPSVPRSLSVRWARGDSGSTAATYDEWQVDLTRGTPPLLSMSPTERVQDAGFAVTSTWDAGVPLLQAKASRGRTDVWYAGGPLAEGRHRYRLVDADSDPKGVAGAVAVVQQPSDISVDTLVQRLADAGAAGVAIYPADTGLLVPPPGDPGIVTMMTTRSDGLALRAAAHRPPSAWIELTGTPRSPYAYDVSFVENGQVGRDLAYRATGLATVATKIYSSGTGEAGGGWILNQHLRQSCGCTTQPVADWVPSTGYTRTQYVTAGRDVQVATAWEYGAGRTVVRPRALPTYRPGEHATLEFLKAPYSPGVAGGTEPNTQGTTTRRGNRISFDYAMFTDSRGNWSRALPGAWAATALFAGDTELYTSSSPVGDMTVPADATDYRLVSDVYNHGAVVGLTSAAHTEWTFRSATVAEGTKAVLPLLDVDYTDIADTRSGRSALDLANSAARGQRVDLDLAVGHQPGSIAGPVSAVKVLVSSDDGATWQKTVLSTLQDGRYRATYTHPRTGDFISLKVLSSDTDGNAVDQTLIHAYRLR